jgi:thiamine pyrophosphate-dependent acetolactate synthase large subunit-like protein
MICGVRLSSLKQISNLAHNIRKPTIGNYIIESLVDKNINIVFGYNKMGPYSPFYKYEKEYEQFDIVFEKYEETCGYRALTYSKTTNNMGVMISTSTTGFGNLMSYIKAANKKKMPILLLSFFDPENELKSSPFPGDTKSYIKESLTIKTPANFSTDMEDLLSYSYTFPAGPVHLNVSNKILDEPIDLMSVSKSKVAQLPIRNRAVHPNVEVAKDLCDMTILNQRKMRKMKNFRSTKHFNVQQNSSELIDVH